MNLPGANRYSGQEKREFPRADKTFLVVCKDASGTVATIPHFIYAYGKNISKGGIFFESVEKFSLHTSLEFNLYAATLPESIKVTGRIIWTKPAQEKGLYYYGVSFCDLSSHDMLLVEQLVGAEIDATPSGFNF